MHYWPQSFRSRSRWPRPRLLLRPRIRRRLFLGIELYIYQRWWIFRGSSVNNWLKYFTAPGYRSSLIATASSSPAGKISWSSSLVSITKGTLDAADSASRSSNITLSAEPFSFLPFLCFLLRISVCTTPADSSALTFLPRYPNQAKKLIASCCVLLSRCSSFSTRACLEAFSSFNFCAVSCPCSGCLSNFLISVSNSNNRQDSSSSPSVKSFPSFQRILTGSLTSPVYPVLLSRYQNVFSRTRSSNQEFSPKVNVSFTLRGSPTPGASNEISNRETWSVWRVFNASVSQGWMKRSISSVASSKTIAQKCGIFSISLARSAKMDRVRI